MDTNTVSTAGFLLLVSGKDWVDQIPTENLEQVMERFTRWSEELASAGKVKGGQALSRTGAIITKSSGHVGTDGPFAESKEVIGGLLHLQVDTFEEAVAIARTSPGLEFGGIIEVRPVLEECPAFKRARERLRLAAA